MCLHAVLNNRTLLSTKNLLKLVDARRRYSKPKQCCFRDTVYSMTENTQFLGVRVHVSPGSAETLVRRGGTTNHRLIAYSLSNMSAKNYPNWSMCVEVIVCNISVIFETVSSGDGDDVLVRFRHLASQTISSATTTTAGAFSRYRSGWELSQCWWCSPFCS